MHSSTPLELFTVECIPSTLDKRCDRIPGNTPSGNRHEHHHRMCVTVSISTCVCYLSWSLREPPPHSVLQMRYNMSRCCDVRTPTPEGVHGRDANDHDHNHRHDYRRRPPCLPRLLAGWVVPATKKQQNRTIINKQAVERLKHAPVALGYSCVVKNAQLVVVVQ